MRGLLGVAGAAACLLVVFSAGGSAAGQSARPDRQALAAQILDSPAVLTAQARAALVQLARGNQGLAADAGGVAGPSASSAALAPTVAEPEPEASTFRNVRVNDPGEDVHQTDQTTQSETTIAAVGRNVVVGFNDSQTALLVRTAGADFNGYAHSDDGGASFTDGGAIPNRVGCINVGDPWLASDRTGAFYYSSLAECVSPSSFGLFVGVAKSIDGGRTFSAPVILSPPSPTPFYEGDKDAMTAGRDPVVGARENLYDTWDDFTFGATGPLSGLPVARSIDGGQSWHSVYAAQVPLAAPCPGIKAFSFAQFIGAMPIVDPSSGKLYVAAEKLSRPCPTPGGPPPAQQRSEVIYASTDGGLHFGSEVKIADIKQAFPHDVMDLGPNRLMRTLEFPTLAFFNGELFAAWNDGRSGHSHVLLSTSTNGATWSAPLPVTTGSSDELQPAISGDGAGVHILHYQRHANNTLDVRVANSDNGTAFSERRVTTVAFPGVLTFPQFDPIIAFAYMGDYIANISTGDSQLFAWGDNRDIVKDFLFPGGRNDPDVFFARQGEGENG